jgi:uncharacterized membrane protein (DUF2068 family)
MEVAKQFIAQIKKRPHHRGIEVVAIFEALKGILVLAAGLGLLRFLHEDLQIYGEKFMSHFGLNPEHKYPHALLEFLSGIKDQQIVTMALIAIAYSLFRLIEAYGLWTEKSWGKWLAIISGGMYLPYEFYKIYQHPTWFKAALTFGNILIVIYIVYVKFSERSPLVKKEQPRDQLGRS